VEISFFKVYSRIYLSKLIGWWVFRIAGLAFPRLLNALCQSRVGPRDGGSKTQRAWGQAGQAPLDEIDGRFHTANQLSVEGFTSLSSLAKDLWPQDLPPVAQA